MKTRSGFLEPLLFHLDHLGLGFANRAILDTRQRLTVFFEREDNLNKSVVAFSQ